MAQEEIDRQMLITHMAQYAQRVMLQNKGVEMSVVVTSGFAALIASAKVYGMSAHPEDGAIGGFIVIGFGLYVIIQSLFVANYIYHSWQVQIHNYVFEEYIKRMVQDVKKSEEV